MKSDQMRPGDAWTVGARPLVFTSETFGQPNDLVRRPAPNTSRTAPNNIVFSYELSCSNCGWQTVCGRDDAIARLRIIGQLRRDRDPDEVLVAELLVESAPRMTCPLCKVKQLTARPSVDDAADDWQAAVLCEICREPIDPERVEAIPGTKRCASCQGKAEAGQLADEPDFCPNCGSLVQVRVNRGSGITRYKRVCTGEPPCRL